LYLKYENHAMVYAYGPDASINTLIAAVQRHVRISKKNIMGQFGSREGMCPVALFRHVEPSVSAITIL
jgi:hypothetical protein